MVLVGLEEGTELVVSVGGKLAMFVGGKLAMFVGATLGPADGWPLGIPDGEALGTTQAESSGIPLGKAFALVIKVALCWSDAPPGPSHENSETTLLYGNGSFLNNMHPLIGSPEL